MIILTIIAVVFFVIGCVKLSSLKDIYGEVFLVLSLICCVIVAVLGGGI